MVSKIGRLALSQYISGRKSNKLICWHILFDTLHTSSTKNVIHFYYKFHRKLFKSSVNRTNTPSHMFFVESTSATLAACHVWGGHSFIFQLSAGVTTNSATATNCVSLYALRGIH